MNKLLKYIRQDILELSKIKNDISLSGIQGCFPSYFLAGAHTYLKRPIVVIAESSQEAENISIELEAFIPKQEILYFPSWEVAYEDDIMPHPDIIAERLECLRQLSVMKSHILVTSIDAVYHPTLSQEQLEKSGLFVEENLQADRDAFVRKLVDSGYKRTEMVDDKGDFAVRGGIIDVFYPGADDPLRIEFFGDKIESLRFFDIVTQRSIEKLSSYTILPFSEKNGQAFITDYFLENSLVFFKEIGIQENYISKFSSAPFADILKNYEKFQKVYLSLLKSAESSHFLIKTFSFLQHSVEELLGVIKDLKKNKIDVYFCCANDGEKERLIELLGRQEDILIGHIEQGFLWEERKLALLTYGNIFRGQRISKPRRVIKHNNLPVYDILDLEEGDIVVHINHGIGMFKGLKKIEHEGALRDYIMVEYKDGDRLYVPIEQINLLQKYIGMDKTRPALHKLGGKVWAQTKKSAQKIVRDMASDLLNIQAKRNILKGHKFSADHEWQAEFEKSFLFTETEDQISAIKDIKKDMECERPMDRLLCGDVGFGKTEVAIRAAFKAVMDGKQAAVLVPTTILAQQHYNTFKNRMAGFPIEVEMLSRFRTKTEQSQILKKVQSGDMDIVIGTHRLLSNDVFFKDLGLLIIDEEQRFGVAHKEKIKKYKALVDVLTMTATPLPRTLYMSMSGLRDMSSITTPPEDRLPVYTEVSYYDDRLIKKAIQRELSREGQVFFLHNRVQTIHKKADEIRTLVPFARVGAAHGQMNEYELESIMIDFIEKKYDVLVCTTIIESGMDIPNANTLIVDMADRFGLADLYQLRGRVGRSKHRAYAYFLVEQDKLINKDAKERLSAINEFSFLGSGQKVALRDLELRGTGNLLGQEQHGCIVKVGFDMYCSLLKNTMKELNGEKMDSLPAEFDLKIDLAIKEDYIYDMKQRLEIYRKIAQAGNDKEIKRVLEDIKDRFGRSVPPEVYDLLTISKLKITAGKKGIVYIGRRKNFLDVVSNTGHKVFKLEEKHDNKQELLRYLAVVIGGF